MLNSENLKRPQKTQLYMYLYLVKTLVDVVQLMCIHAIAKKSMQNKLVQKKVYIYCIALLYIRT